MFPISRFLRDDDEKPSSWDEQLATKYYTSLYREFAVCDLKHYKSGNVRFFFFSPIRINFWWSKKKKELTNDMTVCTTLENRRRGPFRFWRDDMRKYTMPTPLCIPFSGWRFFVDNIRTSIFIRGTRREQICFGKSGFMWKMCQEVDVEASEGEGEVYDRAGFTNNYRGYRSCQWRSTRETSEEKIEGWNSRIFVISSRASQTAKFPLAFSSPSTYIWYSFKKTTFHSTKFWWLTEKLSTTFEFNIGLTDQKNNNGTLGKDADC